MALFVRVAYLPTLDFANDAVIKLTKEGVDLAEGTIEDNGVDV